MALRVRRGLKKDFDPNKLLSGELAILTDVGEMHYCFSAGNVKRLQTEEDLQALLNASPTAYTALQQLVDDLNANPSELANILSNISTLQSDVGNKESLLTTVKTSIVGAINELVTAIALKFNKSDIVQTDTVSDTTKVASAAVVREHGLEIDTLNDNLAYTDYNKSFNELYTNFNDTTLKTGKYRIYSSTMLNPPFAGDVSGGIDVRNNKSGNLWIEFRVWNTTEIYFKNYNGTTWSGWSKITPTSY